ncbi:UvrB/UvrC motif-containing protein [Paenisporosarcina cavernae]|uniref:Nucleotide excision repair protein n=1 Tax=Paenisporosarcina cavernae TaxID=2320858 RepID=A0A385YYK1_9BACL|nr:UvrB/UvrC motif-containing protein [Paenisporosarcina cavernae]AYC30643.1 nucleotide excision repair protein [Paenisporosarcina cavernae]
MICENCKQRPAKVTVTQVVNGEQVNRHYCEVCAQNLHPFHVEAAHQDPLAIHQLLQNWFNVPTQESTQRAQSDQPLKCDTCDWTFRQFLNKGKFGCADCYDSFRKQLPGVFKRLHNGNTKHVGKTPGGFERVIELKKQIESLRAQMQEAVAEENFEEAATLRDEARMLEEQLKNGADSA